MTTAAIALGIYAVIVVGILWANHRFEILEDREPEVVNWLPFLPPVPAPITPPFSQTVAPADLFDGVPIDCLGDDAVHSLFDRLVAEGLQ